MLMKDKFINVLISSGMKDVYDTDAEAQKKFEKVKDAESMIKFVQYFGTKHVHEFTVRQVILGDFFNSCIAIC